MEAMAVRMCSLWGFLVSGSVVTSLPSQWPAGGLVNSSVACVRGSQQSPLELDCRNAQPQGMVGRMYISRIFYGTTPIYKGCNRTAPFSSCCLAEPDVDCVFESDIDMADIVRRFSGSSQATFDGFRRYSSLGNCDPKIYPNLTSYSVVEFGCASVSLLKDITADVTSQSAQVTYLDSNGYFNNSDVKDSEFNCVAQTECNSSLSFIALFVRRGVNNDSHCAEEFVFQDGKYPEVQSNVTCAAGNLIFNQVLFTSTSNVATINMLVTGRHTGKVFIKIKSSKETSDVILTCGANFKQVVDNLEPCAQDPYVAYNTSPTSTDRVPVSTNSTQDAYVENSTSLNSTKLVPIFYSSYSREDNNVALIMGLVIGVLLIFLIILSGFILVRRCRKPLNKGESATALSEPHKTVTASSTSTGNTYDVLTADSGLDSRPPSYAEVSEYCKVLPY